jgi:hypothetical protein
LTTTTAVLAALALATVTSACTDGTTSTTPTTPTTPTTKAATVQDPKPVLAREVIEIKAVIDGLVTSAGVRSVLTGDEQSPCSYDQTGDYPVSWSYARRLFAGTPDSRPLAHRLAAWLRDQGWSVTPFGDPDGDKISLTAQKEGARIGLNAGSTDGGVAVTGHAACVDTDGSVRTTPVA